MLVAAPLAAYIPLASLGGVLAVVAWNMAEKAEFASLLRASWGDATVLMATFLLTIFADLTIAIGVGVTLGAFLFLHRMAETVEVEGGGPLVAEDTADGTQQRPHHLSAGCLQRRRRGLSHLGRILLRRDSRREQRARPHRRAS